MIDRDDFFGKMEAIEKKMGKVPLSEEDLLMLACFEISKTYTRDEKNYT